MCTNVNVGHTLTLLLPPLPTPINTTVVCAVLAASSKLQSGVPDVRNWVGAMNKKGPQYFKELYADAVKKAKDRADEERKKREEQLQMRDVGNTGRKW
jgi:hypothetical protein